MLQAEVWSEGKAAKVAQVRSGLVKTQPDRSQTETAFHGNVTPDASLFLIPVCLMAVWAIAAFPFFREIAKTKSVGTNFLQASKIPCQNCQFFSKNSYLKCAVHPTSAMTEAAINCSDYCSIHAKVNRN